jgi:hypothetical protein
MKRTPGSIFTALALVSLLFLQVFPASAAGRVSAPAAQALDPNPPTQTVRLLFIHHSTGENWLRDDYGGLGQALADNNYFVSDTNYGWGPDAIGDRTDIPNWPEWFASARTPTIMQAVFNESGQNSSYTRLSGPPAGGNTIIMFKSCFPNSALEGSPQDAPDPQGELTVGHAKYVYNQILPYFGSQPDRLFIVITAPPLSDGTYARNARAFNNWLVDDWLAENGYTLNNVAVFDFYNVLTAKQAHHWYKDGEIQHIVQNKNTTAYPSGDDHPNEAGSRKATDEFIPLLNIYYNRWAASSHVPQPTGSATATTGEVDTALATGAGETAEGAGGAVPLPPELVLSVDDFESGAGWEPDSDASTASTITCYADQGTGMDGSAALLIDFSITPGSWGTCALFFESPQDWSDGEMLAFQVHSADPGLPFSVAVYHGTQESRQTYSRYLTSSSVYTQGYVEYTARWDELLRPEWEENAGTAFTGTDQVLGLSFGLEGSGNTLYKGMIWIDNVTVKKFSGFVGPGQPVTQAEATPAEGAKGTGSPPFSKLPCLGGAMLPIFLLGFVVVTFRSRHPRS